MGSFFTSAWRTMVGFFGTILGTVWLLGLYTFAVWAVVGSLTSIQIRDEFNAKAISEGRDGISFADASRRQVDLVRKEKAIRNRVENHPIARIDKERLRTYQDLEREKEGWVYAESIADLDASNYRNFESYYCSLWSFDEQTGQYSEVDQPDSGSCVIFNRLLALDAEKSDLISQGEEQKYLEMVAKADEDISGLRENEPMAEAIEVIEFFEFLPLYNEFLKEPRELLVMQLTMAMGALGSVITMTWSFVRRDGTHTIRRFLMLPFVGAISAFVILVFLKAGQLTVTAGQASDDLDPFVLSFVGIVSGLLSERAYARMSDVGNKFFAVEADIQRYGVHLKSALSAQGIDNAEVVRVLKLKDSAEAESIIAGEKPLSILQQNLLAALTRKPSRELFSDQEPMREMAW
jgi:hypothetical protein